MAGRILIDMIKLRNAMICNRSLDLPEAFYFPDGVTNGLKTIRELAIFRFSCRKCEDAPCISVCPADALVKNKDGIITRHLNLCISCKSCVTICPFGTMMSDFFSHRLNREMLFDLRDENEMERFVKACPEGTVAFTEAQESPEDSIYSLNDRVLIKDFKYQTEKE
jgi:Fe-S-cluster-containing dehydrogenase component